MILSPARRVVSAATCVRSTRIRPQTWREQAAQIRRETLEAFCNIEMLPVVSPMSGYDEGWDAAVKAYREQARALLSKPAKGE